MKIVWPAYLFCCQFIGHKVFHSPVPICGIGVVPVLLLPLWDISAVAGPKVFTVAVEETRAKEAEEEDGQLSALPRDDAYRREFPVDKWRRG